MISVDEDCACMQSVGHSHHLCDVLNKESRFRDTKRKKADSRRGIEPSRLSASYRKSESLFSPYLGLPAFQLWNFECLDSQRAFARTKMSFDLEPSKIHQPRDQIPSHSLAGSRHRGHYKSTTFFFTAYVSMSQYFGVRYRKVESRE